MEQMQNNQYRDTVTVFSLLLFSFLGFFAVSFFGGGMRLIFPAFGDTVWYFRASILLQDLLVFFLPAYYACRRLGEDSFRVLKLKPIALPRQDWLYVVFIFVVSSFATSVLERWNTQISFPESLSSLENWMREMEDAVTQVIGVVLSRNSFIDLILNLLLLAVAAAFVEEVFFRGTLQQLFVRWFDNEHGAVWLTAFIFSAGHLQFYGFFPRLFLGVVLGYLFVYSRNLWVPIFFHFINNALIVVVRFFSDESSFLNRIEEMEITWLWWIVFALSVWCTVSAFYKYRKIKGL